MFKIRTADGEELSFDRTSDVDLSGFLDLFAEGVRDVLGEEPSSEEIDDVLKQIFNYEIQDGSTTDEEQLYNLAYELYHSGEVVDDSSDDSIVDRDVRIGLPEIAGYPLQFDTKEGYSLSTDKHNYWIGEIHCLGGQVTSDILIVMCDDFDRDPDSDAAIVGWSYGAGLFPDDNFIVNSVSDLILDYEKTH